MDFFEFIELMKNIPKPTDIDELCKSNFNYLLIEKLASWEYFKLLSPIQKYHLFTTACAHNSIDIAILIYKQDIDLEGVKELMLNYLVEVAGNTEYVIFRWLWEQKQIIFTTEELEYCFIQILNSTNLEFAEWFWSLNLININTIEFRNKIGFEILNNVDSREDYGIAAWICTKYSELQA